MKTAGSERFRELEGRQKALNELQKEKIDALLAIGGDGSFNGLLAFSEICDLPLIGIPGNKRTMGFRSSQK